MGSYDEAEICKLNRLYFLHRLGTVINKSRVSLYGDGGLLQQIMQMAESLVELIKLLLHYIRKKDFQSPLKEIFSK